MSVRIKEVCQHTPNITTSESRVLLNNYPLRTVSIEPMLPIMCMYIYIYIYL